MVQLHGAIHHADGLYTGSTYCCAWCDFWKVFQSALWYQFLPCSLPFLQVGNSCSKKRRTSPITVRSMHFLNKSLPRGGRSCRPATTSSTHAPQHHMTRFACCSLDRTPIQPPVMPMASVSLCNPPCGLCPFRCVTSIGNSKRMLAVKSRITAICNPGPDRASLCSTRFLRSGHTRPTHIMDGAGSNSRIVLLRWLTRRRHASSSSCGDVRLRRRGS